jgi:LPS O-antigen subunit length determinant protein (WzzB/FepE family)
MHTADATRPVTPAERHLRIVWASRLLFLLIVVAFTAGAAIVTALQPRRFTSQALLAVRGRPRTDAELRARLPVLTPTGTLYDANDPERQNWPGRYAPRLSAPGLVTLAARDAGVIGSGDVLDQAAAARMVQARAIEGSDVVKLEITQSSPTAAQALAAAIVRRGLEEYRRTEDSPALRQKMEAELKKALATSEPDSAARIAALKQRLAELDVIDAERELQLRLVDPPTLPLAPSSPRADLYLSVGFALGVLAASATVAIRHALGRS